MEPLPVLDLFTFTSCWICHSYSCSVQVGGCAHDRSSPKLSPSVITSILAVKDRLKTEGWEFNKRLSDIRYSPQQPYSSQNYKPELETSTPCTDSEANYFQNLIVVLQWVIELGRIDINYEVAFLSQYLAYPRKGHLFQAIHIFKYLEIHHENFLRFDPTYLDLGEPINASENPRLKAQVLREYYPDTNETIPTNAPPPRGKAVQINCFVDADHAGNLVT